MKVASGNEKQALQQLNPNFMSDEEDGEDLAGTWIVRSPPWRSPRLSSMLPKLQEKIDSQPSSHSQNSRVRGTPCTHPPPPSPPAWAVCADDRERTYSMRGPPLHCQQCHPDNFAPSHLSLPQNMAVEMKVMKIWTIYFQTVLLELLGKEGVFEYYKTKQLFLNIQCM